MRASFVLSGFSNFTKSTLKLVDQTAWMTGRKIWFVVFKTWKTVFFAKQKVFAVPPEKKNRNIILPNTDELLNKRCK